MQLAREEDDSGGVALKDCFAKDLSFVLILLVFIFLYWICDCLKVFLLSRFMNCFVFLKFLGQCTKGMV